MHGVKEKIRGWILLVTAAAVTACSSSSSDGADPETGGTTSAGGAASAGATSATGGGGSGVGGASVGSASGVDGAGVSVATGGGASTEISSPYGAPCTEEGDSCPTAGLSCEGFSLGAPGYDGLTCSNTCPNGSEDCRTAPAGYPETSAPVACLPFTTSERCVLVCDLNGQEWDCPSGMSCVVPGGGSVGYCLWL